MTTITIGENTGGSANTFSGCSDTQLSEGSPTTNYASANPVEATKYDVGYRTDMLLKFPGLSNIPAGATITAATLYIKMYDGAGTGQAMSLFRALRNWNVSQTTWNVYATGNNWTTGGGQSSGNDRAASASAVVTGIGDPASELGTYIAFSGAGLVADIQGMADSALPNYGWFVERTDGANDTEYMRWHTSESANGDRPYLSVTYTTTTTAAGAGSTASAGASTGAGAGGAAASGAGVNDSAAAASGSAGGAGAASGIGFATTASAASGSANGGDSVAVGAGVTATATASTVTATGYAFVTFQDPIYQGPGSIFNEGSFVGTPVAGDIARYSTANGLIILPNGEIRCNTNTGNYPYYYKPLSTGIETGPYAIVINNTAYAPAAGVTANAIASSGTAGGGASAGGAGVADIATASSGSALGGAVATGAGVTDSASASSGSAGGASTAFGAGVTTSASAATGSAMGNQVGNASGAGVTATANASSGTAAGGATASGAGATASSHATNAAASSSIATLYIPPGRRFGGIHNRRRVRIS